MSAPPSATGWIARGRLAVPERRRAILCLVTDRRRLAARLRIDVAAVGELLLAQLHAAAVAGVDLVQIREGDLPAAELVALTRQVVERLHGTATQIVVNDRVDVALVAGAHGVHLKAASMRPWHARSLARDGWLIGQSIHDPRAEPPAGADYLVAGTVKPSASKPPGSPLLGFDGLQRLVLRAREIPVLGVGGLSAQDVPALRHAGAAGLAGIDAFLPDSASRLDESVQRAVATLRLAFDSSVDLP
jgi:thiamine-phosphate diphosphorylase